MQGRRQPPRPTPRTGEYHSPSIHSFLKGCLHTSEHVCPPDIGFSINSRSRWLKGPRTQEDCSVEHVHPRISRNGISKEGVEALSSPGAGNRLTLSRVVRVDLRPDPKRHV